MANADTRLLEDDVPRLKMINDGFDSRVSARSAGTSRIREWERPLADGLGREAQRFVHVIGGEVGIGLEDCRPPTAPSATNPTTVATGIRRPRMHGTPPI